MVKTAPERPSPPVHSAIVVERHLAVLDHRARRGCLLSFYSLAAIAQQSVHTLHGLWTSERALIKLSEVLDIDGSQLEPDPEPLPRRLRREALQQVAANWSFPVLDFYGESDPDGTKQKAQNEMLHGLRFGTLKGSHHRDSLVPDLIFKILLPAFDKIWEQPDRPGSGVARKIWEYPGNRLPARSEAGAWASLAADWLMDHGGSRIQEGGDLYRLATPRKKAMDAQQEIKEKIHAAKKQLRRVQNESLQVGQNIGTEVRLVARIKRLEAQSSGLEIKRSYIREGLQDRIRLWLKDNLL